MGREGAHCCQGLCVAHYHQSKRGGALRKVRPQGPNEVVMVGEVAWLVLTNMSGEEAGRTCLDAADLGLLAGQRWALARGWVARGRGADRHGIHRLLMGLAGVTRAGEDGVEVEHVNGDPLDNRRGNLRVVP